jgi:hypothetical protein
MIHVYTAKLQPAWDFFDAAALFRMKSSPLALGWCWRCRRRRRLKNLVVQVYYDQIPSWCANSDECERARKAKNRKHRKSKPPPRPEEEQ